MDDGSVRKFFRDIFSANDCSTVVNYLLPAVICFDILESCSLLTEFAVSFNRFNFRQTKPFWTGSYQPVCRPSVWAVMVE